MTPEKLLEHFDCISDAPDAIPRLRPVRALDVIARMKPGVTLGQANAELNGIARGLAEQYRANRNLGAASAVPLRTNTYTAPASSALLSPWSPLTPVALLSSNEAPTTKVSPDTATPWPKTSMAFVLEALR